MNRDYPVSLYAVKDISGLHWIASYLDLPGCIGVGPSREKALEEAEIHKDIWLETAEAIGREIPEPSQVFTDEYSGKFNLRIPKSLHRQLTVQAQKEGISLNMLCACLLSSGVSQEYRTVSTKQDIYQESTFHPQCKTESSNTSWGPISNKIVSLQKPA